MKSEARGLSSRLAKGVYLIECRAGALPNRLPLLWGERPVLIDAGLPRDPDETILPALHALGLAPADLALLINSHADIDHNGGNASLRTHCPQARLACGEPDRALIESPAVLWAQRWNQLEADHGIAYPRELFSQLGPGTRVDWAIQPGDGLDLGGGRYLQAIAALGHSYGHLAFLLRPERILFCGDSVQGDGRLTRPQYVDPDVYLGTLRRVSAARPSVLVTCHLGSFRGAAIQKLLAGSRQFVSRVTSLVRRALNRGGPGQTLAEITAQVSRSLAVWEPARDIDFAMTVHGHLLNGIRRGWVRQVDSERPLRFRRA